MNLRYKIKYLPILHDGDLDKAIEKLLKEDVWVFSDTPPETPYLKLYFQVIEVERKYKHKRI